MKLLPKNKITQHKDQIEKQTALKQQNLEIAMSGLLADFNQAKDLLEQQKLAWHQELEDFKQFHEAEKTRLAEDIRLLAAERARLLKPLDDLKAELSSREVLISQREDILLTREKELEVGNTLLQEDYISYTEAQKTFAESKAALEELKSRYEARQLAFEDDKKRTMASLEHERIIAREMQMHAENMRQDAISAQEANKKTLAIIEARKQKLDDYEKKLVSERKAIDAVYQEARNNGLIL